MTDGFERYRLDEAVAPIDGFVDDLSTWYIRRSRDRIRQEQHDGALARETLRFVLTEFSKCLAPIAPFYAEYLFGELRKYHPQKISLPKKCAFVPMASLKCDAIFKHCFYGGSTTCRFSCA